MEFSHLEGVPQPDVYGRKTNLMDINHLQILQAFWSLSVDLPPQLPIYKAI